MSGLIDSHCHLCDRRFRADYDAVVDRARAAGVVGFVNVAYDVESAKAALRQAQRTPGMVATAGVHPHNASEWSPELRDTLRAFLVKPEVVAVGEMGLDFFRNLSSRDRQKTAFEAQLELARETGLPAIVHDREAHAETVTMLHRAAQRGVHGVVHCFTGDWKVAAEVLDCGFFLGLTGLVTSRATPELTDVARRVPLDRLLLETDCPYLTPAELRGQTRRNEPAFLPVVARFVAQVRGEPVEVIVERTAENARKLFGLPTPNGSGHASQSGPRAALTGARKKVRIDTRTRNLLEFDKVVAALAERAATDLGRERCLKLRLSVDSDVVRRRLAETTEARLLLDAGRPVPFGGLRDIRPALHRARIGSVLSPADLLAVGATLGGLHNLREALLESGEAQCPRLGEMAARITPLSNLEKEINRCIDPEGVVRDEASVVLQTLRRRLVSLDREAHRRVDSLISDPQVQKILQEPLATIRNDRLCVPVRAECRSQLPGLVHDQSASGATLFVEPVQLVELGNRHRQTRLEEREEIHRILTRLTRRVAEQRDSIQESLQVASILDFIVAKGKLSADWRCTAPRLVDEPVCDFLEARHPLLGGNAVPVDVRVGESYSVLVVTGPNTGGKTVTLKTVGLLCLMAAAGLHLPAGPRSRVHLFSQVFADIGDEQSLEQSLSTFSARLRNIVQFVRHADDDTLVLLDEIGVGTDPDEGAALAKAILRRLRRRGSRVVATTHYSELKNFAFAEAGMENACVEFDPQSLRPTYRVLTGVAGSSNAFVIARRLGLPKDLVREAEESQARQKEAAASLLRRMEQRRRELDREATAAQHQRQEAERLREEQEQRLKAVEEESEATRQAAMAAAGELLARTRTEAEAILRRLRRQTREGKPTQQAMDRLRELERETTPEQEPQPPQEVAQFQPGRRVRIPRLRQTGVVLTQPTQRGKVSVRTETATVELATTELELLPEDQEHEEPAYVTTLRLARRHVPAELNLMGLTVEEACFELDKYLDDAALAGLPFVRLIHGKGTGALRRGVHEFLRDHAAVDRFELADLAQGGDGATVAYLKRV